MNKTVYLRDDEVPLWERARELSGDKLSPVIVSALKRFVAEREAAPRGYERILLEFNDAHEHNLPKRKAFFGRWIISPQKPLMLVDEGGTERDVHTVAETAKGAVVVTKYTEDNEGGRSGTKLWIYGSFMDAAANTEINYPVRKALEQRGVPVEELDI
jgi:hypothetical protein